MLTIFSRRAVKRFSVQEQTQNSNHIGAELRDARMARGLSFEQVSEQTKIRPEFLNAIETLAKDDLPSIGYVLGYVRSYAKFLDMDGNSVVARYKLDSAVPENLGRRNRPHFVPTRKIRLPRGFIAATTVLSTAAMLFVWYGTQTELQAAVVPAPDLSITEELQAPLTDPNMLTVRALAPSWIQIKDKSGRVIISRVFVTGETWQTPRGSGVSLTARDGGAVALFVGDTDMGALGKRGVAIENIQLANSAQTPSLVENAISENSISENPISESPAQED